MKRKKKGSSRRSRPQRGSRAAPHPFHNLHKERGAVIKKWSGRIATALIFPDTYALGMSNIGFQFVYQRLNRYDHIVAERFFVPDYKSTNPHSTGSRNGMWRSVESNRPLRDFDIIIFSISFETSYINAARALKDAGIALLAEERDEDVPLVLAGGVACQINPEPFAPFADAFLLGDFEAIEQDLVSWLTEVHSSSVSRKRSLEMLAHGCPGAYVPAHFKVTYSKHGEITGWDSQTDLPFPPKPAIKCEPAAEAPHTTIISHDAVFSDMTLIELSRGCGRGCRFCAAGFVYRPPRPWDLNAIDAALANVKEGERVGMVGLEFLEREEIMELCSTLLSRSISLAFSSLRADAITRGFVKLLRASGSRTATIAPEAGSSRLRQIINKNLTEDEIMEAVTVISEGGISNIKCYFMLGLPFEEQDDIEAIVHITDRIRKVALEAGKKRGSLGTITVSASTFVPKAWTPFQWAPLASRADISKKQSFLQKSLSDLPNVVFRHDSWKSAFMQAALSRGGRELAPALRLMAEKGLSFKKAVMSCGIKTDKILKGFREDEILPWGIIRHRVKRTYLHREWRHAAAGRQTSFCNTSTCRRCGACDKNRQDEDDGTGSGKRRRTASRDRGGAPPG